MTLPDWARQGPPHLPSETPVSLRELDMVSRIGVDMLDVPMEAPVADPCPGCGAFRMVVGDWYCWGHCWICEKNSLVPVDARD